jgi:hypothetical protein
MISTKEFYEKDFLGPGRQKTMVGMTNAVCKDGNGTMVSPGVMPPVHNPVW